MKYTESHEWIEVQGEMGRVGVSEYAQRELGDIVYVELPSVGRQVKKGEEVVVLESTKAAADVYAPVSGKIVEVNTALRESPDLINKEPEGNGWLFKIELTETKELKDLLTLESYHKKVNH